MQRTKNLRLLVAAGLLLGTAVTVYADGTRNRLLREIFDRAVRVSSVVEFPGLISQQNALCDPNCPLPVPDPIAGRGNFGFNADQTELR
ncbi:MAG: hypothetical protein ACREMO_12835 [Gemmatimonadales bacterium]